MRGCPANDCQEIAERGWEQVAASGGGDPVPVGASGCPARRRDCRSASTCHGRSAFRRPRYRPSGRAAAVAATGAFGASCFTLRPKVPSARSRTQHAATGCFARARAPAPVWNALLLDGDPTLRRAPHTPCGLGCALGEADTASGGESVSGQTVEPPDAGDARPSATRRAG